MILYVYLYTRFLVGYLNKKEDTSQFDEPPGGPGVLSSAIMCSKKDSGGCGP